ncbi:hypothetical protein KPH14_011623 [Odynerus spinipes]|uniref:Telomerase reverse transcriptase n=1 Tax=Odynerus spinipes TaxID=1348599 RepID=A0AAD9VLJ5_9HYME|nr:hypothetical protein KPH14_011623 [Odynerus spinipes]
MENSNLKGIGSYFGVEVETYCKRKNILPIIVKCGAFKLRKISDLQYCETILRDNELEKQYFQLSRPTKFTSKKKEDETEKVPKNKNKKGTSIPFKKRRETDNVYLNRICSRIIIHDNSAKLSAKCPTGSCILDIATSGTEICNDIMETKVRSFDIENNNDHYPSQQLMSILESFQKKHKKNKYQNILEEILLTQSTSPCFKLAKNVSNKVLQRSWQNIGEFEITSKQLDIFFTQILIRIVPLELFGSFKNREIITRIICRILRSTRFQPIYLKPYINQLNIDNIEWLRFFEDESVKWLFTIKLVKWFILRYIIKILYKYVHVTVHPSADGKRLYIQQSLWHRIKNIFIKENIRSKVFVPVIKEAKWCPPKCEYRLFFKNSGVRPIVKVRYTKIEAAEIKLLLKFLKQLYITHYGLTSSMEFHNKWKGIIDERSGSECNKTWLVSCDLADAYGSILQDQLNSIIEILCEELPERLELKWIGFLSPKRKVAEIKYEKYFVDLHLVVPVGAMYAPVSGMSNMCLCYVKKKALLKFIKMCIFHQKVQVLERTYLIGKGILQGTMLSNILFDIYYTYISHQRLSTFMKSGMLFRYVDDILYATENMESATEFIETIKKGFIEYNCKFKESKIQTNLPYENYTRKEIIYLGYKINCDTLEALPCYQEAHPRYLFTVTLKNRKRYDTIKVLINKLYNCSHLRLSHIILKDPIHFNEHLKALVKQIALMNAWRSFLFIEKLIKNLYKYDINIFHIIQASNKKIVRILLNHYTQEIEKNANVDRKKMRKDILKSLWGGYKRVFSHDDTMRHVFVNLFTREIQNLDNEHAAKN